MNSLSRNSTNTPHGRMESTVSLLSSRTCCGYGSVLLCATLPFLRARTFFEGKERRGERYDAMGTFLREDGGNGRTRNRHFTGRGERRERSVTRGEKQERRKETRYLFCAVIRRAINLENTDAGQELSDSFLIATERTEYNSIFYFDFISPSRAVYLLDIIFSEVFLFEDEK